MLTSEFDHLFSVVKKIHPRTSRSSVVKAMKLLKLEPRPEGTDSPDVSWWGFMEDGNAQKMSLGQS